MTVHSLISDWVLDHKVKKVTAVLVMVSWILTIDLVH